MLRVIVYTAVIAGAIGGVFASAAQSVRVVPLILQAETYEQRQAAAGAASEEGPATAEAWTPDGLVERVAATLAANLLAGIGFALLLAAAFALSGGADWHRGLLWGLGGFATFTLAPALGLPPEIPGAQAAALADRQLWWLATVVATGGGLALLVRARRFPWPVLGALLVALPHAVGAPQPDHHGGAAPEELARAFATASMVTNFLFWLVLGAASGFLYQRFSARS